MTFRELKPEARYFPDKNARMEFWRGVLVHPVWDHVVWTCEHRHDDYHDARACAETVLHCDEGSQRAEEMARAVREAAK